MKLTCWEIEFREKLITDLYLKGITAHNLGSGIFDLLVEGDKQQLVELKRVSYNFKGEYDPFYRGIVFSENQTKVISRMKYPPVVIAYDCYTNESYLITPKWLKNEFPIYPSGHKATIYVNSSNFPKAMEYSTLLDELHRYCVN